MAPKSSCDGNIMGGGGDMEEDPSVGSCSSSCVEIVHGLAKEDAPLSPLVPDGERPDEERGLPPPLTPPPPRPQASSSTTAERRTEKQRRGSAPRSGGGILRRSSYPKPLPPPPLQYRHQQQQPGESASESPTASATAAASATSGAGSGVTAEQRTKSGAASTATATATTATATATATSAAATTSPAVVIFGCDLSRHSHRVQFLICASGLFAFTVGYGYLQELVVVALVDRRLSGFVSTVQFAGYAFWSFVLSRLRPAPPVDDGDRDHTSHLRGGEGSAAGGSGSGQCGGKVPLRALVGCSVLKAVDLGLTNAAMMYINYPAKTLIKSSRVFFTMITGIVVNSKRYKLTDYAIVGFLVTGLAIFLRAESSTSAVFHPLGVAMLCASLVLDGAVINWSEYAMNRYGMCHDAFNYRLYSISLVATAAVAHWNGELSEGMDFLAGRGTLPEMEAAAKALADDSPVAIFPGASPPVFWTPPRKVAIFLLFSTLGVFGASCGGAITKSFGAFATSVTSTVRKATTLFLSFVLFPSSNACTFQHVQGMCIFFAALTVKSVRAGRKAAARSGGGGRGSPPKGGGAKSKRRQRGKNAKKDDEDDGLPLLPTTSEEAQAAAVAASAAAANGDGKDRDTGRYMLRSLSAVSITELMGGEISSDEESE